MDPIFSQLTLTDVHRKVLRNIVSIRASQDLFDDLSSNPQEWALAQQVEDEVKPPPYQSASPVIHRPFEDAHWCNAIGWPFQHWQASRYSDGSFGVWYGSDTAQTTVYETAYHWVRGFLTDAGFENEPVVGERKLYQVSCDAALVDLRPLAHQQPGLVHTSDYTQTQTVGARLHREGHPGLVAPSVRHPAGHNYVILNPDVLSSPQQLYLLTYRLNGPRVVIEKQEGVVWMEIRVDEW